MAQKGRTDGRLPSILYLDTEGSDWRVDATWLHYVGRMLLAIQDAADALGYKLEHLPGTAYRPGMDLGAYAGVIGLTHRGYPDKDQFWAKWEKRLPCVFLGSGAENNNIESDQERGMDLLVGHLLSEGHERIGFLHHIGNYYGYGRKRHEGFVKAMATRKVRVDPAHILLPKATAKRSMEPLEGAFERLVERKCQAVCFSTDEEAMSFKGWADGKGIRVPGDIAITGYNDWLSRNFLTSIHYDYTRVGRTALLCLDEMIRGERPGLFPSIGVPPSLRARSSSLGRPDTPSLQDERTFRELVESQVGGAPGRDNWPEELSHRLHLSRAYFLKKFRRLYGEEFARYLGRVRCQQAAFDISHTSRPITDIWLEAGFKSAQHFHQRFTDLYKTNPREYRKKESSRLRTGVADDPG